MQQIEKVLAIAKKYNLYPQPPRVTVAPSDPEIDLEGNRYVNYASNNYLGLANHPEVKTAVIQAIGQYGVGTCASRMAIGNTVAHLEFEQRLSAFIGVEDAVVTSSGYLTNVGVIPAVMDRAFLFDRKMKKQIDYGVILSDEKNHSSIVDGIRLSHAERVIYRHADMADLEQKIRPYKNRRKLIVSDAVFSVDGDIAPLSGLVRIKDKYDALLMLDEAHSFGVLGTHGRGIAEHYGLAPESVDINMGTLSKALGSVGGYIAGKKALVGFVRAAASPFVLTAGPLAPALAAGATKAIEILERDPEIVERLWDNVRAVKRGLDELHIKYRSGSQIIMIPVGDERKLVEVSKELKDKGVLVSGMRWPAVPWGDSRIRLSVIATHSDAHIIKLLQALQEIKGQIMK